MMRYLLHTSDSSHTSARRDASKMLNCMFRCDIENDNFTHGENTGLNQIVLSVPSEVSRNIATERYLT
jgi:hypothetical protein